MTDQMTTATQSKTSSARSKVRKVYKKAVTPPESREDLLQLYLPIVKSIVARIKINLPPHIEEEDLYSVGLAGLISALKKYDPSQKKSFGSYAAMRIRGAILDELRRMDWMPRNARTNFKRLRKTVEELEQRLGRPASEEEVRSELDLTPQQYEELLDEVRPISFLPLDHNPGGDEGEDTSLYDVIADENVTTVTDKMEKDEMIRMVAERINQLPEVPRKVLAMYYYEDMRLAEIAAVFGLTESRICQIHSQAILSLRTYLTNIMNK
jgi:RNA polymerase sigma factor for flagellar operon FliA